MMTLDKETAIRKITEMPIERVSKVLIFMAGMEAEHAIDEKSGTEKQRNPTNYKNWKLKNNSGKKCRRYKYEWNKKEKEINCIQ